MQAEVTGSNPVIGAPGKGGHAVFVQRCSPSSGFGKGQRINYPAKDPRTLPNRAA